MIIYENCIEKVGLDIKKVKNLARRLEKLSKDAQALDIQIFGGTGCGSLRYTEDGNYNQLILAEICGHFSGGDGFSSEDREGFLRGE